jgi:tryptophanyl-tRNA synthetase
VQHLEITRAIARSFNATFQREVFPEPQVKLNDAAIVPGIDGQKMSKSYDNTIPIFATDAELEAKVKRIKTDSTPKGNPLDPENDTVFALYRLVANADEVAEMRRDYLAGAVGYGDAKMRLLGALQTYFGPYRQRRSELVAAPDYVEGVLQAGAKRAGRELDETMRLVRDAVGLLGQRT